MIHCKLSIMTTTLASKSIAPPLVMCIIFFIISSLPPLITVSGFHFHTKTHHRMHTFTCTTPQMITRKPTLREIKILKQSFTTSSNTYINLINGDNVTSDESNDNDLHEICNGDNDTLLLSSTTHTSSSLPPPSNLYAAAINLLSKELWFLPFISLLSGIPPSIQIIGQSHISRMPDCPIAHDVDTLLLWPAVLIENKGGVGVAAGGKIPFTLFQYPFAAVTDKSMYTVDWSHVFIIYGYNVFVSLLLSFIVSLSLVSLLSDEDETNITL